MLTVKNATIILPLITAVITFLLTSIFTLYREKKNYNIANRAFFEYGEYIINPTQEKSINLHGKGLLLLGQNGLKLYNDKLLEGYSCLVIKNITKNDVLNVKIKSKFSDENSSVEEEFVLPVWKNDDTLYIPQTIYEANNVFSTNDELLILYTTPSFERFRYGYRRQHDGIYEETLEKNYFKIIWIKKWKIKISKFFKFVVIRDKKSNDNFSRKPEDE